MAKQASKSNAHCDSWPALTVTARTSLWKWVCKQLLLLLVLLHWPICNIDRLWNVRFSSAFFFVSFSQQCMTFCEAVAVSLLRLQVLGQSAIKAVYVMNIGLRPNGTLTL